MKVISILNHKGGVGKTTFTGSTSQALALIGFRVLVIDNDSQHNLSSLMGVGVIKPSIRDVYRADIQNAPHEFLRCVRKTELPDLHIITSSGDLCDSDVVNIDQLKLCIEQTRLERFYDFILIDNPPGLDRLQGASIRASHEIFVPTELRQFAVDGLVEMEKVLQARYPDGAKITRIIPNFYRNVRRQNAFIAALNRLFPGKLTATAIPVDSVFDELVTDGKILFLHRLYSKGAAYYLKVIHELFDLDEDHIWESVAEKRKQRISDEARQRFFTKSGMIQEEHHE